MELNNKETSRALLLLIVKNLLTKRFNQVVCTVYLNCKTFPYNS